jgi:hypothetical protein
MLADHPGADLDRGQLQEQLEGLDELARIRALFDSLPSDRALGRLLEDLSAVLDRRETSPA